MKKLIPILLAVFALSSCEKDPDMGKLDNNYLVYTNYDKKADFKVPTFYLADQILVINDSKEPEYLEGEGAEQILAAYTENMEARGYTAADTKENADLHRKYLLFHQLQSARMVVGLSRLLGTRLLGRKLGWRMVLSVRCDLQL